MDDESEFDDDASSLGPHAHAPRLDARPQTSAGHEGHDASYDANERKVYEPDRRPGTTEWTGRRA